MPKRVTLKNLLEARLLQVGEELTYPSKGHIHRGQLNRNGSVVYQGMNFKTPSAWANQLAGVQINGWEHVTARGQKLSSFRHKFLSEPKPSQESEPEISAAPEPEENTIPESSHEGALDGDIAAKLYERVSRLEPDQFERLVGKLLRCKGLLKVEVTGRSNDGGIDGNCEIPFLKLKVAFQAKRYMRGNSVGIEPVQRLAGSIANTYDRGIFITTSTFTTAATSWVEETKQSITLIDGDELIRDMIELELGINVVPVVRQDVDEEFFSRLARQM